LQLQLRVERLRAELAIGRRAATLLEEAAEVAGLCELASVAEARAVAMLGSIQLAVGAGGWLETLQQAVALARLADEFDVECGAAATIVLGHLLNGDGDGARGLAREMEDRCAARLLRGAQLQFAASRLWLDLHGRGACAEVAAACRALLADPVPEPVAGQLQGLMALALADAGELREAELLLEHALGRAPADRGRFLSWTRAEVMWLAGEAVGAANLARDCREDPLAAFPVGALAAVTAAWAASDAGGQAVGDDAGEAVPHGEAVAAQVCGGSAEELAGIERLVQDPAGAREAFVLARDAWAGIERRGALRCAWAGAEAARRAGERDVAVSSLQNVRSEMIAAGITAIVSRVNRSLREAGVREASGRSADERGLTAREREVLKLVAQGLSTVAIARRLGLEGATVETHIESAREKLGAANRTQAAILAFG
jgi:DNA-binding NarL/FixJ family response regulator